MKKIILILFALLISIFSYAQGVTLTQEQLDSLPPATQAAIKASVAQQQVEETAKTVSKYAGMGKEIGKAVNGALGAVENHVVSISKTKLGQTAIFLVCWKFLYKDIAGAITGAILILIISIWIWNSLRYIKTDDFKKLSEDGQSSYIVIYAIIWVILFIASMFCIF